MQKAAESAASALHPIIKLMYSYFQGPDQEHQFQTWRHRHLTPTDKVDRVATAYALLDHGLEPYDAHLNSVEALLEDLATRSLKVLSTIDAEVGIKPEVAKFANGEPPPKLEATKPPDAEPKAKAFKPFRRELKLEVVKAVRHELKRKCKRRPEAYRRLRREVKLLDTEPEPKSEGAKLSEAEAKTPELPPEPVQPAYVPLPSNRAAVVRELLKGASRVAGDFNGLGGCGKSSLAAEIAAQPNVVPMFEHLKREAKRKRKREVAAKSGPKSKAAKLLGTDERMTRRGWLACIKPPLSPFEEERVDHVMRACTARGVADVGNITLPRAHFVRLEPGGWLSDRIVNAYMELLQAHFNRFTRHKVWFTNSFLAAALYLDRRTLNYGRVSKWLGNAVDGGIMSLAKIIVPVNLDNSHWFTVAIELGPKTITFYDSMAGEVDSGLAEALKEYVALQVEQETGRRLDMSQWHVVKPVGLPQQTNLSDSGVFALAFAAFVAADAEIVVGPSDIPGLRRAVAAALLRGRL